MSAQLIRIKRDIVRVERFAAPDAAFELHKAIYDSDYPTKENSLTVSMLRPVRGGIEPPALRFSVTYLIRRCAELRCHLLIRGVVGRRDRLLEQAGERSFARSTIERIGRQAEPLTLRLALDESGHRVRGYHQ